MRKADANTGKTADDNTEQMTDENKADDDTEHVIGQTEQIITPNNNDNPAKPKPGKGR